MSDINVSVLDQQLQLTSTPTVAAQGVNEDYIVFDFLDNSWSGFSMVALFFAEDNPEAVYQSVVNSAGRALVPWEATQTDGAMYFGLAGVKGDIRYTSELVRYKIVAGLYEGAESVEPTPSVYEQWAAAVSEYAANVANLTGDVAELSERLDIAEALQTDTMSGSKIVTYTSEALTAQYDSALQQYYVEYTVVLPAGASVLETAWSRGASDVWQQSDLRTTMSASTATVRHTLEAQSAYTFKIRVTIAYPESADLAELQDIRVGADGTVYASAGAAVRAQAMQLDSTLTEAGKAADAKATGDAIDDLKDDFSDFMTDTVKEYITPVWAQNRIMASNNVLTEVVSDVFINSGFILTDKNMVIDIPSGYSAYAWRSMYGELGHVANRVTSAWSTGVIQYEYNSTFPYLIICVQKSPSATIDPSDGVAVKIYELGQSIYATKSTVDELSENVDGVSDVADTALNSALDGLFTLAPDGGQIVYNADDKVSSGHIGNAVMRDNGVIVASRSNGTIVEIGYGDTENTLLSVSGRNIEWRCLYKDSGGNIYCAPHATFGTLTRTDRGLYRLANGGSAFTKVISLYDTSSSITSETEENDDTIWTMCEDATGNLYAGVYAHSVRANPAIYKSIDGGLTWTYIFNFKTAGLTPNGMHIHSIVYSKWQDALYCIVGEVNTIFKSTDGAITWTDLHVELASKGSAMLATENGILIGSDNTRWADIDILFNDDTTHKRLFRGWANTVFAIRRSDLTGFIYVFTKVDTSVNNNVYYPPVSVLSASDPWEVVNTWKETVGEIRYNNWLNYYNSTKDVYQEDAFRPTHYGIIVSRDGGRTWSVLKRYALINNSETGQTFIDGFLTTGYFYNGECLTGRIARASFANPIAISEGKHKYTADGIDISGEILVRTNTSNYVTV